MSIARHPRRLFLGIALAATLAAVVWVSQEPAAGEAEPVAVAQAQSLRLPARREAEPEATNVQLERLSRKPAADPTQNAFASRSWVKPPPPAPEAPAAPPGPPPLPFTYMGKLQEGGGGNVTVYLQQGEQAYSVRQGDVIDNTWRVDSIGPAKITLTYLPMRIQQTLSLGDS